MQNKNLNVVIIGASGSLGGEFVKQLSKDNDVGSIFAFSRSIVHFDNPKIESCLIDIEDEDSIALSAKKASKGSDIDMVVVATGMLHDKNVSPEKSLKDLSKDKFCKLFAINTISPAIIAKHFLPKLNKKEKSIFATLSARVGSISDNRLGGWYSYRSSKSALNMVLKNASIEIQRSNKNAIVVGLHPGTVDSELSKPFQGSVAKEKLFTAQYSVKKLLKVIDSLNSLDSGNIIDFNGTKIDF